MTGQRDLVTVAQLARELGIAPQTAHGVVKELQGVAVDTREAYWRDDIQAALSFKHARLLEFLGYADAKASDDK